MVQRGIIAALQTIGVGLGSATAVAPQAGSPAAPAQPQGPWSVIQNNCFGCHNSTAKTGGLALDTLSPDHIAEDAQTWEAVIRKLRGGLMPPPGAKHPEGQSVVELISW